MKSRHKKDCISLESSLVPEKTVNIKQKGVGTVIATKVKKTFLPQNDYP